MTWRKVKSHSIGRKRKKNGISNPLETSDWSILYKRKAYSTAACIQNIYVCMCLCTSKIVEYIYMCIIIYISSISISQENKIRKLKRSWVPIIFAVFSASKIWDQSWYWQADKEKMTMITFITLGFEPKVLCIVGKHSGTSFQSFCLLSFWIGSC